MTAAWADIQRKLDDVTPLSIEHLAAAKRGALDAINAARRSDAAPVIASRFVWRDPEQIPRRECLYAGHYHRKFMSQTVGAGGGGKSLNAVAEALAMVTGQDLLGYQIEKPLRIWYVNLEDPREETERRITAAAIHYRLDPAMLEGNLFIDSGREQQFVVVKEEGRKTVIVEPIVQSIIDQVRRNEIDVIILDPFVSTHEVDENDNSRMQQVAQQFVRIADEANCAVELVHHVGKNSGQFRAEVTADAGRGAGAVKDKARSVRVLSGMTGQEAGTAGIAAEDRFDFFRIDFGKANLQRRSGHSDWRRMVSVMLGNGGALHQPSDHVGVVTTWHWPSAERLTENVSTEQLEAIKAQIRGAEFRSNSQANDWAGRVICEILNLEVADAAVKKRVKRMLDAWISAGHFEVVRRRDLTRREWKEFVVVKEVHNPEQGRAGEVVQ